jgi:hypothetical protein
MRTNDKSTACIDPKERGGLTETRSTTKAYPVGSAIETQSGRGLQNTRMTTYMHANRMHRFRY